jgi:hypothetical protein
VTCNSGLRMMVLVVVAASIAAPGEALAVPPRRLARRGVIVVPPPGAEAIVVPVPGSAPVVVGPALRPRRRMLLQPGPAVAPGAPSVAGRQPAAASPAAPSRTPTPAAPAPTAAASSAAPAKAGATAAVTAKPAAASPEQIPAPQPTPAQSPAGQPTVANATPAATPAAESVAFTPDWYAKHPEAWRPRQSPADWWKTADVATITGWLGKPIQPVMAAGTAADNGGAVATAGGAGIGADGLQSVLVLPAGHQNAVGPADSDWLPLGVFAVVPPGTTDTAQAHNYQQLAVDRQGTIKGNFFDAISGTVQPITGTVDRTALTASWTVGANGSRFTAPMRAFAGQPRTVSMLSGGQPRDLELMPVQGSY